MILHEALIERAIAWARGTKYYVIDGGRWNFALALLALLPVFATFLTINLLTDLNQLQSVIRNFQFDKQVSAEAIRSFYIFGLAAAGFFPIAVISAVVCIGTQCRAAPAGPRRRRGLWAAFIFAAILALLLYFEPWSRFWFPISYGAPAFISYRSPDLLFSETLKWEIQHRAGASGELPDKFGHVWEIFRFSAAVFIATFTFAAAAAAACASPISAHPVPVGQELRFFQRQIARHHRIFYAAAISLLAMLFVERARLDVYQAILNTADVPTLQGFKELRSGLEVYWGGLLTLCLAMIYVPAAWHLYTRVSELGDGAPSRPDSGPSAPQVSSPPAVALRIALVLLPTLFSGGVSELIKSILEQ